MITITSDNGMQVHLTEAQVRLLHKACHKMERELQDSIYDLTVFYSRPQEVIEKLRSEKIEYTKLQHSLGDLED